jgi:hypothetical protein
MTAVKSLSIQRAAVMTVWKRAFSYKATKLADETCGLIRLKLLKIGALVRISVRRVKIAVMSSHRRLADRRNPA